VYNSFLARNKNKTVRQCLDSPKSFGKVQLSLLDELSAFSGPKKDYSVLTLAEVGKAGKGKSKFKGGETQGAARFIEYMKDEAKVADFAKPVLSFTKQKRRRIRHHSTHLLRPYYRHILCSVVFQSADSIMH
jgi:hypothetical protein